MHRNGCILRRECLSTRCRGPCIVDFRRNDSMSMTIFWTQEKSHLMKRPISWQNLDCHGTFDQSNAALNSQFHPSSHPSIGYMFEELHREPLRFDGILDTPSVGRTAVAEICTLPRSCEPSLFPTLHMMLQEASLYRHHAQQQQLRLPNQTWRPITLTSMNKRSSLVYLEM